LRHFAGEIGIDASRAAPEPLALADVEQGRGAASAVFHHLPTGEPEVQKVMGQQHRGQPRVVLAHGSSAKEFSTP